MTIPYEAHEQTPRFRLRAVTLPAADAALLDRIVNALAGDRAENPLPPKEVVPTLEAFFDAIRDESLCNRLDQAIRRQARAHYHAHRQPIALRAAQTRHPMNPSPGGLRSDFDAAYAERESLVDASFQKILGDDEPPVEWADELTGEIRAARVGDLANHAAWRLIGHHNDENEIEKAADLLDWMLAKRWLRADRYGQQAKTMDNLLGKLNLAGFRERADRIQSAASEILSTRRRPPSGRRPYVRANTPASLANAERYGLLTEKARATRKENLTSRDQAQQRRDTALETWLKTNTFAQLSHDAPPPTDRALPAQVPSPGYFNGFYGEMPPVNQTEYWATFYDDQATPDRIERYAYIRLVGNLRHVLTAATQKAISSAQAEAKLMTEIFQGRGSGAAWRWKAFDDLLAQLQNRPPKEIAQRLRLALDGLKVSGIDLLSTRPEAVIAALGLPLAKLSSWAKEEHEHPPQGGRLVMGLQIDVDEEGLVNMQAGRLNQQGEVQAKKNRKPETRRRKAEEPQNASAAPRQDTAQIPAEARLADALRRLFSHRNGHVIVLGDEGRNCYVQFACDGEEVQMEAVAKDLLTDPSELTGAHLATLKRLGWDTRRPSPNYTFPATIPPDDAAIGRLAKVGIATLREAYGCPDGANIRIDENED